MGTPRCRVQRNDTRPPLHLRGLAWSNKEKVDRSAKGVGESFIMLSDVTDVRKGYTTDVLKKRGKSA